MSSEKSQIDLKGYWGILGRRRSLIILPLMIVPLVAFAITYFIKPSFVSSVTILINETKILPTTVEREVGDQQDFGFSSRTSMQERQSSFFNQITSTNNLRRLIAVLNLPITEDVKRKVAATKASYPEISETDLAENIMAEDLRKDITVNLKANNLIEINISADDPVFAQKLSRTLADIFIEENLAQELAGVRSNISFSQEQLEFYKEKLKNSEDRLRDYRQALVTTSVGEDTSSSSLQQLVSAVDALDTDISRQKDRQVDLRGALLSEKIDVRDIGLPQEILSQKDRLLNGVRRLADLLNSYTWKDPQVLNLNEESRVSLNNIGQNIRAYVDKKFADKTLPVKEQIVEYLMTSVNMDFNQSKQLTLNKAISRIKSRIGQDPAIEVTMQRLQSDVDSYKKLYDLFVDHSQYAAINQSAMKVEAEAKYTIIKPASLPLTPDSPKRFRILGMGFALGLALGFGAIMLVEMLDNSFKRIEDVTQYLKLPVLGTVPRIDLPYSPQGKKRVPLLVGMGVSFLLIVLIIFLNFKNG